MNILKKTTTLLSLVIATSVYSQSMERILKWKVQTLDKDKQPVLIIEESGYTELDGIPHYYEVMKQMQSDISGMQLTNTRFIALNEKELQCIPNSLKLESDVLVKSSVDFMRFEPYLQLNMVPLRRNPATGQIEKLVSFTYEPIHTTTTATRKSTKAQTYASNSVLSSGNWVRIKIKQDGVYKLTYEQLVSLGIAEPSQLSIYGNGGSQLPKNSAIERPDDLTPIPLRFYYGTDGQFSAGDYVLFYGKGPETWNYNTSLQAFVCSENEFSDAAYYFLTSDRGKGPEIPVTSADQVTGTENVNTFTECFHYEKHRYNILRSGSRWFSDKLNTLSPNFTTSFNAINVSEGSTARVYVSLAGHSSSSSIYQLSINNTLVGTSSSGTAPGHVAIATGYNINLPSGAINLQVSYQTNDPAGEAWLDFIGVNYRRKLIFDNSQLIFRDPASVASGKIVTFNIAQAPADLQIWEVTNHLSAIEYKYKNQSGTAIFGADASVIRQYVAFTNATVLTPELSGENTGPVANQNLHGASPVDYLIITNELFTPQANALAALHRQRDGLSSLVVTDKQVYNEFSSGAPDVSALRDFVKMFYDRAAGNVNDIPKYLLLLGDGSFDNQSNDPKNPKFMLTYQSDESLKESECFVSDDFFGLLDDGENMETGLLDIGIGRIPVQTTQQADSILAKITRYSAPSDFGDWKAKLCFVADDGDISEHTENADSLSNKIVSNHPFFNVSKIFYDLYPQISSANGERYPDARNAFEEKLRRGMLIVNYTGHGGPLGLSNEQIMTKQDILNWTNTRYPLFLTATCEFSRYDDVSISEGRYSEATSAGEMVLLNPNNAGGIAMFTTTRLVYSEPNYQLNLNFYDFAFSTDANGTPNRLGDIVRLSKNALINDKFNKRNFSLLGDPALTLAYPKQQIIITDSINGKPITEADSLKALSRVTLSGYVCYSDGSINSTFNGVIFPTVYDKKITQQSLASDPKSESRPIDIQESIIFKGKATVKDGRFKFSFVVPKDINYEYGPGKISYYAHNGQFDQAGFNKQLIIGGLSDNPIIDTQGPEIKLYLNDERFVSGALTDATPRILAYLIDENGINTSGNGIGHDISVILDKSASKKIILNDFYESEQDDYTKGSVKYQLSKLETGPHTLHLKAWDVSNNSNEEMIEFIVSESDKLEIKHLFNYPNPFTTHTDFYFNTNYPGQMEVLIQVFTVSGKLVKTIETSVSTHGYVSEPIAWDGLDDYGDKIGKGVYVYRIKLRSPDGKKTEKYEKLVILR